ncbi:hypothetical protein Ga0466249_002601 [Sporomusaceae bacterium BoRhaA]|uniref:hypothetical protein n=1 Tax=Pelorhabdus rhamnosifermentans TaxID=2772457 RepID=UPI001C06211A|nr:hypothetical protein [Pelorhabdus rhamnosifermentans]MBU2701485.1 hypothetical protein [Pelorhabdus rhamnosifermentans]
MDEFCDLKMIGRGLFLLIVMTVFGVMAAEQQMNHLTERTNFVQSFNVVYSQDGTYLAYLFGDSYRIEECYQVGALSNSERAVYLTLGSKVMMIPFIYSFSAQSYFDELYQVSHGLRPKFYEMKGQLKHSSQTLQTFWQNFGRQRRYPLQ